MNNTLSHHGLSYSHPGYASHPSSSYGYPAPTVPVSQPLYGRNYAGSTPPGMPAQLPTSTHSSGHHHSSHSTVPSHLRDPNLGVPLLSAGSARSTAMYPHSSSFFVNPYLSMPLSPGQQAAYGAHTHHYIAPPPDFNVTRGSSVSSAYRGDQMTAASSTAAETGRSQQPHYSSNTSALVPFGSPYPPPPPLYHTPFTAYGYPAEYSRPEYVHVDSVLLSELNDTHLSHLNTDDSPDKLQLRKRMDDLIEQLLSVTPHVHKFSFPGVRETLEKSVVELPRFDAFKASEAFDALASYATNLVSQPWRREYRTIKVYCGYWVHHVAEHLVGAEAILLLMGYQAMKRSRSSKAGSAAPVGCYQLPDSSIVDADVVTRLALDCHIACSECQVLGQLQQHLPAVPMPQLLRYRQHNVGSYQQMVQKLLQVYPSASCSPQTDDVVDGKVAPLPPPKSYASSEHSSPSKTDAPSKMLAASQSQLQLSVSGRGDQSQMQLSVSGRGDRMPLSSLPTTPTCTASALDRLRLSDGIDKRKQITERSHVGETLSSQLMLEQYNNFVESTSKEGKNAARPARPERHRETLSRRPDDKRGAGSVATAKLIDHCEHQSSSRLEHRAQQDVPSSILPKVLPHVRSTKPCRGGSGGGVVAPLDTGDACCLPATIPREVFQDSTLDEHVSKAFSHSQHALRAAGKEVPCSSHDWDFVMKDLEKRGYNKDVGNRGDILQHVSRSSDTLDAANNQSTNTDGRGELIPSTVQTVKKDLFSHVSNTDGRGELIPSTVQSVKKDLFSHISSNNHNNNLGDLCASIDQVQVGDRRVGAAGGSSGSSTARDRASDRSRQKCGGCSSTVSDKRQSVYDNVSCEGFETARQYSDEEEDVRRRVADRLQDSSNYHSNLLPGEKYSATLGSSAMNEKHSSPQPSTNSSTNASNRQSAAANLKSSKPNNKKLSFSAVLTGKLSNSDSNKNKSESGSKQKSNEPVIPWSCITCTFYNEKSSNICEMCSKSRPDVGSVGPIKPLETGGKECQQCTLINDKSATECSACSNPLESCPTYI